MTIPAKTTATHNKSTLIASAAQTDGAMQAAMIPIDAAAASAVNVIARSVLDSLKTGSALKGTVHSYCKTGAVDAVWVTIQIPLVGQRRILVRNDQQLQRGDDCVIECVPLLSGTRHIFRISDVACSV